MNYIGSKRKLLEFIYSSIESIVDEDLSSKIFCDIFAGTGTVAQSFKSKCKQVISNDLEYYAYVLNRNLIGNSKKIAFSSELIQRLNDIKECEDGFIYQNYALGSGSQREYFSDENAKKIDAIRVEIQLWKESNFIDADTYYFLLASLLESSDKVANTASVYSAFLKGLKKQAQKKFILKEASFQPSVNTHLVYNEDANELIKKIKGDILYLDPPYNKRQYGANYHILNTIAQYKAFDVKGKTGIKEYQRSKYCKRKLAANTLEELIKDANFKFIFLSYNDEGYIAQEQIKQILQKYGSYECITQKHKRFNSNQRSKSKQTLEYLHIIKKSL